MWCIYLVNIGISIRIGRVGLSLDTGKVTFGELKRQTEGLIIPLSVSANSYPNFSLSAFLGDTEHRHRF